MHVYLSGPMTGIPDFNRPAFGFAARVLRTLGFEVTNPAEQHVEGGRWKDFMRHDIALMMQADCIVTLPGWRKSRGASLEIYIGQQIMMPVYEFETFTHPDNGHLRGEVALEQLSLNI